ncbi:hypothetical protein GCM10022419_131150 [Nonomuraea rosea]|uniref:Uncharacterized protein n=1 Tax=Nonomuraea rosea TaxID=638574 RepID=A0ABP7A1T1_9ACTN
MTCWPHTLRNARSWLTLAIALTAGGKHGRKRPHPLSYKPFSTPFTQAKAYTSTAHLDSTNYR